MERERSAGQSYLSPSAGPKAYRQSDDEVGQGYGCDPAVRREILRRLVLRSTPADQAPQFHQTHPDLITIAGPNPTVQDIVRRVLDGAAELVDRERRACQVAMRQLKEREEAFEEKVAQRASQDGLPEDMRATLDDAIRRFGRTNHAAARIRLGERVYEAIKSLGHGCGWSWLCQQPALSLPDIANKVDRALGRRTLPVGPYRDRQGGGTHHRNTTPAPRQAVTAEALPELLLPQVRALNLFVPIHELKLLRLTAPDWNVLVGRVVKKVTSGFVRHERFGAYLLASARRWEQDHPIKTRG